MQRRPPNNNTESKYSPTVSNGGFSHLHRSRIIDRASEVNIHAAFATSVHSESLYTNIAHIRYIPSLASDIEDFLHQIRCRLTRLARAAFPPCHVFRVIREGRAYMARDFCLVTVARYRPSRRKAV